MTKLRVMRLKHGYKVNKIAKILNCSEMAIYNYENGKRKPSLNCLKTLAKLFDCKIDDLID